MRASEIRCLRSGPACQLRQAGPARTPDRAPADVEPLGVLSGHFAVFNRWTEIDSSFEGRFLERIAPGAFLRSMVRDRRRIRALFQHGTDPQLADRPLGPIRTLREDAVGAYYEVDLLDTTSNRDLLLGLRAGLYGASFRFRVMREHVDLDPPASALNPQGMTERTILDADLIEFGPVTWPAYPHATALAA